MLQRIRGEHEYQQAVEQSCAEQLEKRKPAQAPSNGFVLPSDENTVARAPSAPSLKVAAAGQSLAPAAA